MPGVTVIPVTANRVQPRELAVDRNPWPYPNVHYLWTLSKASRKRGFRNEPRKRWMDGQRAAWPAPFQIFVTSNPEALESHMGMVLVIAWCRKYVFLKIYYARVCTYGGCYKSTPGLMYRCLRSLHRVGCSCFLWKRA